MALTCETTANKAKEEKMMTDTAVVREGKGGARTISTTTSPYRINKYVKTAHTMPQGSHTNQ